MSADLARRLVACKGWRWMKGMEDDTGRLFIEYADCGEAQWLWVAEDGCEALPVEGRIPGTTSPAMPGLVLHLVREAWGASDSAGVYVIVDESRGGVEVVLRRDAGGGSLPEDRQIGFSAADDLATARLEALCVALEAADGA